MLTAKQFEEINGRIMATAQLAGVKEFEDDLALILIDLKYARNNINQNEKAYNEEAECHAETKAERDRLLLQVGELKKSDAAWKAVAECAANERNDALRLNDEMRARIEKERDEAKAAFRSGGSDSPGAFTVMGIMNEILSEPPFAEKREVPQQKDTRNGCIDFGHKGPTVSGQEGLDWVSRCKNCGEQLH